MVVEIYHVSLTIMEHTYFASREVGILYESEPLIGNYALTYALGLCASPYDWAGPPRYKQDLEPLNEQGIYVTPATFEQGKLRYVISQFNAQSDGYYFRFDQNAIRTDPAQKARPANFPQSGKIRMLGLDSQAYFYLINQQGSDLNLPNYIRLGKFNSKARLEWEQLSLVSAHPQPSDQALDFLLNAADLPPAVIANLRAFSVYNIYPAPLLRHSHLEGNFWHCKNKTGKDIYLPTDMRFGVGGLE